MIDVHDSLCFRFFSEILSALKSTNQHEKVLSLIVDRTVRLFHCQTCAVILIDPATEYLSVESSSGLSLTFCNAFRRQIATAAVGRLLWTGQPALVHEAHAEGALTAELQLEHPFGSCACMPIAVDQRPLGYMFVDSREPGAFSSQDLPVLQIFADLAGIAIVKARLFEENLRLDTIDHETGLEKYLPFLERLRLALERARAAREPFGVLLLDVDNFKQIVNTYGYEVSRVLLRELAAALREDLRPLDVAARYGFDEFILLLEGTDLERAVAAAGSIVQKVSEREFTDRKIRSTVSIGVAAYPDNGISDDDLLTTAKRALFEAQRRGRNMVHHFLREWYAKEPAG
jgi:diguanylate cyclase (GGDEF)-like protein